MGSMRRKSTGSQYESCLKSTQAQGFFKNFKNTYNNRNKWQPEYIVKPCKANLPTI